MIIAHYWSFCYNPLYADHKTSREKVKTRPQTDYRDPTGTYRTAEIGQIHAQTSDTKIINAGVSGIG